MPLFISISVKIPLNQVKCLTVTDTQIEVSIHRTSPVRFLYWLAIHRARRNGTSVDYWPVTEKQGEVHHPACSNANPNQNTNLNPNPNPTADPN